MSSILKALKKLEDEKSRLEEPKEINVSRELLKQSPENRKVLKWLWLFGSSAAIVIIMLTFALIRKPATKEAVQSRELPLPSQPAAPLSPPQSLPIAPQLTVRDRVLRTIPTLESSEPKQQKPSRQTPAPGGDNLIKNEQGALPVSTAPAAERQKTVPALNTAPVQTAVTGEAALTLSGIAWNKDSSDRLAIINGQPTAVGATVNEVVVEEILLDRVKLSHNGRIFELFIGKSTKTD